MARSRGAEASDELLDFISDFPLGRDIRDPYPRLAELRRTQGIVEGDIFDMPHLTERPTVSVLRYADVSQVLSDPLTFTSGCHAEMMGLVMGRTLLEMDGDEHRVHRDLVSRSFWQKALARWESELVAPLVEELIDRFSDRGHADLVPEFAVQFPVRVIARIYGLPPQDQRRFVQWSLEMISVGADPEKGMAASRALAAYFTALIEHRRRHPEDDIISQLATVEVDGQRLTDDEIVAYLRLLLPAGVETTYRSSGNLIFGLLTHPDQLEAVSQDRSLIGAAIEEALRWEPPLPQIPRLVVRDSELSGKPVAAGALLEVWLGSANRDETRFPEPDRFDIFRPAQQHRAFGFGSHMCLGMHLARMEMRVALDALLERLDGLRLDPAADDPHIHGLLFRSPTALPVLYN
ncbi:MAG: cytochrome P450 [Chloroflexi bacterium]|nr:MAG: cytochrome P450 [Chloroflexota bacterium]